jgi:lysophospholipid acyltransferase (LPLAT)-like uncharacterized protein
VSGSGGRAGAFRALLGFLAALFVRLLVRTYRAVLLGVQPGRLPHPCIYAFLHGRQAPLHRFPRPRTAAAASRSPDGRLQAQVLRGFGFDVIHGSSSRGGTEVLAGGLRHLDAGRDLALAVDGPHGPRGVVKPGVVWLAARSGAPIVPLAAAARRAWTFPRSWDGFRLPKPFARVALVAGEPIRISDDASPAALDAVREELEIALGRLGERAERAVARRGRNGAAG